MNNVRMLNVWDAQCLGAQCRYAAMPGPSQTVIDWFQCFCINRRKCSKLKGTNWEWVEISGRQSAKSTALRSQVSQPTCKLGNLTTLCGADNGAKLINPVFFSILQLLNFYIIYVSALIKCHNICLSGYRQLCFLTSVQFFLSAYLIAKLFNVAQAALQIGSISHIGYRTHKKVNGKLGCFLNSQK